MTVSEKIKVKDVTTHSKNDKDRKPRIIELEVCGIKFRVHRYIHIPGTWFLSSNEFNVDKEDMKTDDLNEAIHNARVYIIGYLDGKIIQLQQARNILFESEELSL